MNERSDPNHPHIQKTPLILALIAGIVYLIQAIYYALYQIPIMDEGAYLYKGYQYILGNYSPFQPYGFWTNKMYLPFYLYGWIQKLFSPGLLAPRLFAIFLGLLTLLGTWQITRRLGNNWLAAFAVWAFALNPELISTYSLGISQVLVICAFTWVLVLVLGENQPAWQVIAGACLAAVMIFLRENMIFVIPLLAIYLFWQHGKKIGLISLLGMVIILIIGHLIFWPGILYLWTRQIPVLGNAFIEKAATTAVSGISKKASTMIRIHSLATALRVFTIPLLCSLLVLVFWPKKGQWKTPAHQNTTIFLLVTYAVLLITHAYASIGNDYCIYCSTNYFAFFGSMGLIIFAAGYSSLDRSPSRLKKILLAVLILAITTIVGFSLFEIIGYPLINIKLPRIHDGTFAAGNVHLWQIFANKYGLPEETTRKIIPAITGFLVGIVTLALMWLIPNFIDKYQRKNHTIFSISILMAIIFAISPLLDWLPVNTLSNTNIPAFYQSIAQQLKSKISSKSHVYLDGSFSTILLLYLPDAKIYPPQINGDFSYKSKSDDDAALKAGLWDANLERKWRAEADVFIIGQDQISSWLEDILNYYLLYDSTESNMGTSPDALGIYVFSRNK